jgi:cytochrome c oxidase assembly factor CtaG
MTGPYEWSLDAEALVLVPALSVGYALALRRFPASRWRIASFVLGQLLLLAVFVTPLESLALHYLLTAHLLQNVVLAEWAPGLTVLAVPPALALALGRARPVRVLTHPVVALLTWLGIYFAWHVPWLYDLALRHPHSLLHLEHACYFLAGCMLWWPVFQDAPRRLPSGVRAAYLFAAFVLASPLGLLMALLPSPAYDFYVDAPRVWGLSPLADQQVAGLTMAAEQAVVFFVVCARFFLWFLEEEQPGFEPQRYARS